MMLKRFTLLLLLSLSSLYAHAASIMVLGDSISASYGMSPQQGWVHLLEQTLEEETPGQHRIINASVSGETSGGGLNRLPALLATHKPELVIIELGGNDGLRGYPLPKLQNNLAEMIDQVQAANSQAMLIGMHIPPNYGHRYSQQFAALYTHLADRYNIPLIPNFIKAVATDQSLMQNDGIHPNSQAQPILMQQVLDSLRPQLDKR